MSRTILSSTLRLLAAGGLLGGAGLIAPATTQAQSISYDRALLNHRTAPIPVEARLSTRLTTPADPEATSRFDGERALLGRAEGGGQVFAANQNAVSQANVPGVDGAWALLARNEFSLEAE
jgi:hypothetical protein